MRSRIPQPGFEMAGKTGTAQVRRITKEERHSGLTPKNASCPGSCATMRLFIAFAPVDKPRYAAPIVLEHGGNAHTDRRCRWRATSLLSPRSAITLEHAHRLSGERRRAGARAARGRELR